MCNLKTVCCPLSRDCPPKSSWQSPLCQLANFAVSRQLATTLCNVPLIDWIGRFPCRHHVCGKAVVRVKFHISIWNFFYLFQICMSVKMHANWDLLKYMYHNSFVYNCIWTSISLRYLSCNSGCCSYFVIYILFLNIYVGGAVASWLVCSSPEWSEPWPGTLCCVLGQDT